MSLVRRYQLLLERRMLGSDSWRDWRRILIDHPTALIESAGLAIGDLEIRLAGVNREIRKLREAAPLPAPADRPERKSVLALADLEWWMRELRVLRRLSRSSAGPESVVDRYEAYERPDALPEIDEPFVRAVLAIRRGALLGELLSLAARRHGAGDFRGWLLSGREGGREGDSATLGRLAVTGSSADDRSSMDDQGRTRVCLQSELNERAPKRVDAFGTSVAVFTKGGELFALDDACPHRGGSLHLGDLEKGTVVCPLHGWAFFLSSGEMRGNPRICVRTYGVEVDGGVVFIRRK